MKNFVQINKSVYEIPDDKLEYLKQFLNAEGIKIYNLEQKYTSLLCNLSVGTAARLDWIIRTKIPAAHQGTVKGFLVKETADALECALTPVREASVVPIPQALRALAEYRTSTSSGSQIGRGELVVPLMFSNAQVNSESNAVCDVTIADKHWHVKNGNPKNGIRMGSAKKKLFSATEIYRELVLAGVDPTSFNELNQGLLKNNLEPWAEVAKISKKALYEKMSKQAVETSVGNAAGILWYYDGNLIFTEKNKLSLDSTTQFRSKLSTHGRQKILEVFSS